ncbi:hypothetical protein BKA61DRAFT_619755 [Leptodontidium sp. MPI-SDFR-AT-0119]|nr:hypothetical protein BKA61DRAFT_619755 [Leptodontidium sp. MPI-SDFR-AT-0119]
MLDWTVAIAITSTYLEGFLGLFTSAALPLALSSISVTSKLIGNVTSTNTKNIRDLGFSGTIGNITINTYGDTLICGDGSAHDRYFQTPPCVLLHANSAAYAESDPQKITDFNLDARGNAQIFCGYFDDETPESHYGMGLTNVIAQPGSSTQGILYFLKNYRPKGVDGIVGAGVAVVDILGKYPTCRRTSKHMWNASEPQYGDHGQLLALDGWVYVYGGTNTRKYYDGVYVMRVRHASQKDLSAYEYWNGAQFTKEHVYDPSERQAILGPGSTQGTVTWNPHLNAYVYVYTYRAELRGKTATRPEGPFSDYFTIFTSTEFAFVYSPSQQTHYDPSGKTLVLSYTGYPNIIQAVKATFG